MILQSTLAIVSFALAKLAVPWLLSWFSFSLRRYSPVVGAPIFNDFDVNRAVLLGYLEVFLVPLTACALFYFSRRALKCTPLAEPSAPSLELVPTEGEDPYGRWKTAAVGFVLGWLFYRKGWTPLWLSGALGCCLFSWVVYKVLPVLSTRYPQRSVAWFRAGLHLAALPFAVWVLWVFSAQTQAVWDGVPRSVNWFPFLAATVCFFVLAAFCAMQLLQRDPDTGDFSVVGEALFARERVCVALVLTAVGLWALDAAFPIHPWLPGHDFFHWGEGYVPASLLLQGKVPWRDFLFIHGLLEDVLQYYPGLILWGESLWAAWAGRTFWFHPVGLVLIGFFYWAFFKRNLFFVGMLLLLLLFPALFIGPSTTAFVPRFFLMPVCLVACLFFLKEPSIKRTILFAFPAVLELFLGAETFFLALGFAAVVIVADVQSWDRQKSAAWCARRTLLFGGFSLGFVALGFALLASLGALEAFLDFHLRTASGHRFTGGGVGQRVEPLWIWGCLATLSACFYAGARAFRHRRMLSADELTMGAVFIFNLLYYQKFLSRPDSHHFLLMWMPSVCLSLYCFSRLLDRWDAMALSRLSPSTPWKRPVSAGFFLVTVVVLSPRIVMRLGPDTGGRLDARLTTNSLNPALGAVTLAETASDVTRQSIAFFGEERGEETFFDFTNQPLLFHYLVGLPVVTRFPFVSVAIHPFLQDSLIQDLEKSRPRYVAYYSNNTSYFHWDGVPNPIRHSKVSAYLLDHYQPKAWVTGNLILERKEGVGAPRLSWNKAIAPMEACAWGYVLSNWSTPYTAAPEKSVISHTVTPQAIRLSLPPASSGKAGFLDLYFQSVQEDEIDLVFEGSRSQILFHTKAGDQVRYRVPVGSCPQWYARQTDSIVVKHRNALTLEKAVWVPSSLGFSKDFH